MDDRLAAILALQRRLDGWRQGWHRQHKKQLLKQLLRARAPEVCKDCRRADVINMYGILIYGCDMSHCIAADDEF